jgi:hypothetical protein
MYVCLEEIQFLLKEKSASTFPKQLWYTSKRSVQSFVLQYHITCESENVASEIFVSCV